MKYDVHLYATVRVKVSGIEADSMVEAIVQATKIGLDLTFPTTNHPTFEGHRVYSEYADEVTYYLVDESDDEDHENSKWFNEKMREEPEIWNHRR